MVTGQPLTIPSGSRFWVFGVSRSCGVISWFKANSLKRQITTTACLHRGRPFRFASPGGSTGCEGDPCNNFLALHHIASQRVLHLTCRPADAAILILWTAAGRDDSVALHVQIGIVGPTNLLQAWPRFRKQRNRLTIHRAHARLPEQCPT